MKRWTLALTFAVLVAASCVVAAQEAPAPPVAPPEPTEERKADPAALALIKKAQEKAYSYRTAGLEDLACKVDYTNPRLGGSIVCRATFEVPDKKSVEILSVPERLEPMRDQIQPQISGQLGHWLLRRYEREAFDDLEDYHATMKEGSKDTVVLAGFRGESAGNRLEVRFGEAGLPVEVHQHADGGVVPIQLAYVEKDGKALLASMTITAPRGKMVRSYAYGKHGELWLIDKIELKQTTPMGEMTTTIAMSDYEVNRKAETPEDE
jgi:hypothetical protein